MGTVVLLDGPVFVTYSTAIVFSGTEMYDSYDPDRSWDGQRNGLCGAGAPGALQLVIGTHTGEVPIVVARYSSEPPVEDRWDEVVEVSFEPASAEVTLLGLDGSEEHPLDLPRTRYRVRYCASGLDQADTTPEPADRYLLQFWPAPPAPDRIVRQTSSQAAYWHRVHRQIPMSPAEQATDDMVRSREQEREDRRRFGDRVPPERLRAVELWLGDIQAIDADLMWALAEADDETHRGVARWAALRALHVAGLDREPALTPALAALRSGSPMPKPFDQHTFWYAYKDAVPDTFVPRIPGTAFLPEGDDEIVKQQWYALPTISSTTHPDSLTAALETVVGAALVHGPDQYREFLRDLWQTFPQLHHVTAGS
ncbi:hypothetical protein [Actinoplanes couchii]|uniref:Uncharacterized protein n=1 Tax=Actinoplanes couchii TaxID=403638 RepID=A0ABQ3XTZ1_9ACTN|nr:hypothetical protein [Actinoplanes couchii]MDR6318992.1 hypothetical protein [Actinoplanes couchii]GID61982.1 hypothetical protein Aco03nite_103860 [Actinoplanes couchii]